MDPAKIEKPIKLEFPSNKKEVWYFRDFNRDFAGISAPLSNLTKDKNPEELSHEGKMPVSTLKNERSEYPILQFPDFELVFTLETDASNYLIIVGSDFITKM